MRETTEATGKDEHRGTEDTKVHRERFYEWKKQQQKQNPDDKNIARELLALRFMLLVLLFPSVS